MAWLTLRERSDRQRRRLRRGSTLARRGANNRGVTRTSSASPPTTSCRYESRASLMPVSAAPFRPAIGPAHSRKLPNPMNHAYLAPGRPLRLRTPVDAAPAVSSGVTFSSLLSAAEGRDTMATFVSAPARPRHAPSEADRSRSPDLTRLIRAFAHAHADAQPVRPARRAREPSMRASYRHHRTWEFARNWIVSPSRAVADEANAEDRASSEAPNSTRPPATLSGSERLNERASSASCTRAADAP